MNIIINVASVKVMRSHDYCHFEVCLSRNLDNEPDAISQVDELRKAAARLADKAVEQYKVAKQHYQLLEHDDYKRKSMLERREWILEKPEGERTPEEQALLKTIVDSEFHSRRRYDYQDQWEEEDPCGDDDL